MTNDQLLEAMGDHPPKVLSVHDMDSKTLMSFIVSCNKIDEHLKAEIDMLQQARNDNKAEMQLAQTLLLQKMQELGTTVLTTDTAKFQIGVSKATIIHEETAYTLAKNADRLLDFVKFTQKNLKEILGDDAEKQCVEVVESPVLKVSLKK